MFHINGGNKMRFFDINKISDIHVHMSDSAFNVCENYLDLIYNQGVECAALQSLTYRSIYYNLLVLYWKAVYKKLNLSAFGMIHSKPDDIYKDVPFDDQVKYLLDMGCDGIKLMWAPGLRKEHGHGINDARYDKMFDYLEENSIPMVIHVADPEDFWVPRELNETEIERGWGYFLGGFCSKEQLYEETFERLDRNPNLNVSFAHFFFLSNFMDEAERVFNKYPNVRFDVTPGWEMFLGFSKDIDAWQAFFTKYGDRILFGTDCSSTKNINPQIYELVKGALAHSKDEFIMPAYRKLPIKGLDLDDEVLKKICCDNYRKFIPCEKKVDVSMLKKSAEKMLDDVKGTDDESWLRELLNRI